ncbi:helix-turn-helix domain-containing protein, partial [Vibrio parahaemolyticus]|nr:helix-turn-helix domain-containing protein [Vibrio parahaemolyticus]
ITLDMLPPPLNQPLDRPSVSKLIEPKAMTVSEIMPLWMTEKMAIEQAIEACDGNIPRAAGYLDVSPSTIYRKLQAWNGKEERQKV